MGGDRCRLQGGGGRGGGGGVGGACSPFSQVVDVFDHDLLLSHHRIHPSEPTVRITERFDVQEVSFLL